MSKYSMHNALYGSIKLKRVYCTDCKCYTLVTDSIKQCCNDVHAGHALFNARMSDSYHKRVKLPKEIKRTKINAQGGKCAYCEQEFGTWVA